MSARNDKGVVKLLQQIYKIVFSLLNASLYSLRNIRGHPFMTSTRSGKGVRLRWTHVDGGGCPAPCGRPRRKLKLESTDDILSSHAKKLASSLPKFRLSTEKGGNFSAI